MSKKNLSLLMDGFMGEANQAELAKEQPKEKAVEQVLVDGYRTGDIYREGLKRVGTTEMAQAVIERL